MAVVILLLLCAGGGYLWARERGSNEGREAAPAPVTVTAETAEPNVATTTPAEPATASQTPSTPPAAPAAPVTCWTGKQAAEWSTCRRLGGQDGLDWVFPNIEDLASCSFKRGSGSRKSVYNCYTDDGLKRFTATQWWNFEAGYRNYVRELGQARKEGGRWHWSRAGIGADSWKEAIMYPDTGFSLTVYSATEQGLQELLGLVELRSPRPVQRAAGARGPG